MSGGNLVSGAEGKWRDLSLFVNGKRNATHAAMAPFTSSLLLSDEGQLLRDSTSCVYGSAFFSLLTPGTKLRPHCGPTNIRLRAHLALAVPPGECFMRVGNELPRQWVEGEVLLFDDSFEHEVWNHTNAPRLVLIVEWVWPGLQPGPSRLWMGFQQPVPLVPKTGRLLYAPLRRASCAQSVAPCSRDRRAAR